MPFFARSNRMLEIYNDLLHGSYMVNDPEKLMLKDSEFKISLTDKDKILDHSRVTEYCLIIANVQKLNLQGFEGKTLPTFLLFSKMEYLKERRRLIIKFDPSVQLEFEVPELFVELDQIS